MSASSKFDLSSGSPDRPTYPSGQRGAYAAASLDRSVSFRDGMENRVLSALPSMSRSGSTLAQGDVINFFHGLPSDIKQLAAGQKLPRQVEFNRAITSALGISPDDSLSGSLNTKLLNGSILEELKRVKTTLHDNSLRARDRVKTFNESISRFDKSFQNVLSRKRSRSDVPSSERSNALLSCDRPVLGTSTVKMGTQSHLTSSVFDLEPQKLEERAKNAAPNKRIRTSMADVPMDVRATSLSRPSGSMERDREMFGLGNTVQSEEKDRTISIGVDNWEKSKMKKKRSGIKSDVATSALLTRPLDGDRESKRDTQQRLGNDVRSRLSNAHGFRSGPSNGAVVVGKSDSQQMGLGMRSAPRVDQDNASLLNDRRDRPVGSDKERVNMKAINKTNIRENNSSASPTSITKMNTSARAPRSGPGTIIKSSPNINRATGVPDDWELPQSTNKLQAVVGLNNRKRTASARSSSPPVAQWGGQRPQKISRAARRSNFVPPVSSHDEIPASDTISNVAGNENGLGFPRRLSGNALQQGKLKGDHFSSAALSESEESGAAEMKSKDKSRKPGELDEKSGQNAPKVATLVLPSRKNKTPDEDLGNGVRRQGRTVRGFTSTRSGIPMPVENVDNPSTAKQLRSARLGFDKIESKSGRPPNRKAYTRPRQAVNGGVPFIHGESDGHEELLAAANAAVNPVQACSSSFWRQVEVFFGFISAEDIAYLKQQQGNLGSIFLASTPGPICRADCNTIPNGIGLIECEKDTWFASEAKHVAHSPEHVLPGIRVHNVIPFSQRLIAALILEEENEGFCCRGDEVVNFDAYGTRFELDAELKSDSWHQRSLGTIQTVGRPTSNGYRITATRRYLDELEHEELECSDIMADPNAGIISNFGHTLNGIQPDQAVIHSMGCTQLQYNQMSMDERLLLEVQSIGIFPEPVSELTQREDEEIGGDISRLEEKLHGQVAKKTQLLHKLEKSAIAAREFQEREIERRAFDKLVGMAYEKYMTCWGPNASCGKGASRKIARHAALAFVKQTLERCKKFEDTGESCFNEPVFLDVFQTMSSCFNNVECIRGVTEGEPAKLCADTLVCSPEVKDSVSMGSHHILPLNSQSVQNINTHDKCSSDGFQSVNDLHEPSTSKEDAGSNRVKKRELLDVVGTSLRTPSGIGSSLLNGVKGKRSERDREGKGHNRETVSKNGTTKIGRPSLGSVKGERKSRAKPKQRTTQLSVSVNGLLGMSSELPKPSVLKTCEMTTDGNAKKKEDLCLDAFNDPEVLDLSNLQLPEMQGQDLGSWLNIDEDGLQDDDFMGLEIPMDDLSDLNMMV